LINLGCTPRKSLTTTFPSESIVPKELQHHFIRGYFDGDGVVGVYNMTRKTSDYAKQGHRVGFTGTEEMINGIFDIVKDYGLNKVAVQSTGNAKMFTWSGKGNMTRFFEFAYKDATVYLNRKYERFCNALDIAP
jgi:hypothetical protein